MSQLRLKKTRSPRRRSGPRRSAAPPSAGGSPSPPVPDECYREMVELAPVGVYRSTPEGRFLFANGAFAKILGYQSVEEVLALDIPRDLFLDPADRKRLIAEYGQVSRIAKIDVVLKRNDGSPVPVQLDARAVRDGGGSVLYFEGFVHDITERKRAEQALRESEERHRLILSNIDEIVYVVGIENGNPLESRVQFVSEGVERVAGYPVDGFLRDPGLWLRAVHPDDLSAVEQSTQKILESGRRGTREYRLRHGKTGEYLWIEDRMTPQVDNSGRPVAILGVARDITDRKLAEEKFRSLLESAPDAMVIVDRNGEILLVNAQAERLFGYARQELVRQPVEILVPPRLRERHQQHRSGYSVDPRARLIGAGIELYGLRKDGTEFPVEISLSPLETEEGPLVSSAIRDITERKRAEEELKGSRGRLLVLSRRLIETQEAERRHIARELHDEIGQELTALKINLQAVHRPGGDTELASRLEDSMGIVERAIQQVRDMSLALRPSLLDDLGLVAALRWFVDHQAQRSGFEARLEAEPARISVSPDVEIGCYRVVQEALNNVVRHAQAHNVRVEVALSEGELRLLIQDDGVGFDVEAARERASGGASMGLLSMTERARLLGGHLKVESSPGRGTEIRAVFPASFAR